jgi:hypothetical protein
MKKGFALNDVVPLPNNLLYVNKTNFLSGVSLVEKVILLKICFLGLGKGILCTAPAESFCIFPP